MPRSDHAAPDRAAFADACLAYLAENPDELLSFLQQAGLTPQALRDAMGTERLQQGLLDHFAANEAILLALCANAGIAPESFMRVWHKHNQVE
ncbi:MAG: DUF3572 family protein [Devosia sp.]|uniref:DUF3572 family protein n=1 Tax=Devosia sp. TaxID=1871048 RepID=UPI0024C58118|nr:DUF3572 family protein [Devosia sp.]UYO00401.1 MAG: DUF3572 family protein [Devosia sp.]